MPLTTLVAIELRRAMIRQARSQTAKQQIGQTAQASIPSPDSGKGEAKRSESAIPRASRQARAVLSVAQSDDPIKC
jgi:hypothetical protein